MRAAAAFALALAFRMPAMPASVAASDDALLGTYGTTVVTHGVRISRCAAIDAAVPFADATIDVNAHVPFPGVDARGRYYGRTVFSIRHVTLRLPNGITWPGMTGADRLRVRAALAALRHHEVGHVRIAAAEVARLNAGAPTVTADAETYRRTEIRRQAAGLTAIAAAQRAYDRLTDHGRRQERADGAARGPATDLRCAAAPAVSSKVTAQ